MHKVFVAANPAEAHLCVAALQSEGIEAVIQGEHGFALQGGIPAGETSLPTVWVAGEAAAERAATVIARLQS